MSAKLFPVLFAPIFVAELSLTLWQQIKSVDVQKWDATARAGAG